jgi:CRP-like cAMP-binding protein
MAETNAQTVGGRVVLQAAMLSNCPLHRVGDKLWVEPPQLLASGGPLCVVPLQKACSPRLGNEEAPILCHWQGCEGRWTVTPAKDDETYDLEGLRDDESRPFLLQMPQAVAAALIQAGEERILLDGTRILESGGQNDELYLMREGEVEVLEEHENSSVRIAIIRRGDCFGEMSLLAPHPSSNTIRAISEVKLIAIPKRRFYDLLGRYSILGVLLNRLLARRLRASNRQLERILRPGLWGKLELFPFTSVVESIHQGRMTGVLTITRPRGRAVFGFANGHLRHATTGALVGEDVLVDVLSWMDGVFRFQDEPLRLTQNVAGDTMALLFDAVRRQDELSHDAMLREGAETSFEATDAVGTQVDEGSLSDSVQTLADDSLSDFEEDA